MSKDSNNDLDHQDGMIHSTFIFIGLVVEVADSALKIYIRKLILIITLNCLEISAIFLHLS